MKKNVNRMTGIGSVWLALPLFIILLFITLDLMGQVTQKGIAWLAGQGFSMQGMMPYLMMEGGMLLSVLGVSYLMLRLEHRPWSDLGLSLKGRGRSWLLGGLLATGLYVLGFGLSLALGEVEVTGWHFDGLALLSSLGFFLLVALFEEILMRGYILGSLLRGGVNRMGALLLSSLLFALLHLFNPGVTVLSMVNLVLAGMWLGAAYLYTRNLCFPISLHWFWNWIQGPLLGYQVSGNDFSSSFVQLHLPEKTLLNGGDFGFEGSLLCTVLLLVSTSLILYYALTKESTGKA